MLVTLQKLLIRSSIYKSVTFTLTRSTLKVYKSGINRLSLTKICKSSFVSAVKRQDPVPFKFKMSGKPFERLPSKVLPVNYAVTLKPNIPAFTFEGSEDIQVKVNISFSSRKYLRRISKTSSMSLFMLQDQ